MPDDRPDESGSSPGIKVKDKRRFNPDGTLREDTGEASEASDPVEEATDAPPDAASEPTPEPTPEPVPLPAIDFPGFVLSLGQSALIDLGAAPHPDSNEIHKDLRQARQTIDILAMLADKTKGNLNDAEDKLLSGLLYQLRLTFVAEK
jgi:hypothetical protein